MKRLTTIPFYECHNGVWQTDIGDGKRFTKSDVKKIYADDSRHCVIVLLKDGTEINPDFVITYDNEILGMRLNGWKQRILDQKGKVFSSKAKPWKRYIVYGLTWYNLPVEIGETSAKSPEQAVNNVRFRTYGLELNNDPFTAFELTADGEFTEESLDQFKEFLAKARNE